MVASVEVSVLNQGLNALNTLSSTLSVCGAEPTTIAIAATSGLLGYNSFGAGLVFGAPAAGTPNGQMCTSNAVTAGTITSPGTASWWAVWAAGTLWAHGTLAASQVVSLGNSFTLTSFTIRLPNQ
jgi:Na+-transporting NADH:ubiquinone oxidoreductase subunit NqrA